MLARRGGGAVECEVEYRDDEAHKEVSSDPSPISPALRHRARTRGRRSPPVVRADARGHRRGQDCEPVNCLAAVGGSLAGPWALGLSCTSYSLRGPSVDAAVTPGGESI